MSDALPESGQTTALVLVGLALLAIPTGLVLSQGMSTAPTTTDSVITPLPPLNMTATPTATATPPQGNDTTLIVDDIEPVSGPDCPEPDHRNIQDAVTAAKAGDTVIVCAGEYEPPSTIDIETSNLTLRAEGDADIVTTGKTAIRTTALGVTIRGFTFDHTNTQHRYAIEAGGRKTVIRNNSFELTGNSSGILLSDGLEPETGEPDPTLGPATGSRVVNNVFNESDETPYGIFIDADQTHIRGNTLFPRGDGSTYSIRSTGNKTVIGNNTVKHQNPCPHGFSGEHCKREETKEVILIGTHTDKNRGGGVSNCGSPEPNEEIIRPPGHKWARQNHIVNNDVSESLGSIRITAKGNYSKIFAAYNGAVVKNNIFTNTGGVGILSEDAIIQNNTIYVGETKSGASPPPDNPAEGLGEEAICFKGNDTLISGNYLAGYGGALTTIGSNNLVKKNTIRNNDVGINVAEPQGGVEYEYPGKPAWHAKGNRIINNTIVSNGPQWPIKIGANVSELAFNNVSNNDAYAGFGTTIAIQNGGNVDNFYSNKITNNQGSPTIYLAGNITRMHDNNITGNDGDGIRMVEGPYHIYKFHQNLIDNNGGLGVNRQNFDKTDGEWSILNATHNIWGCGGPSGGLKDPYTNRTANGTGDGLSAGDEIGFSNIHFDPFFVREDVTCTAGMAQPTETATPTPTPTPSPTPTPTLTPTLTSTPTPTPASGLGNGTDGPGRNGTGETGTGTGDTGSSGEPSQNPSGATTTVTPPQSTATPTPPPTPTISPTPRVEPGFGVLSWLVGTAILVTLVGLRRGRNTGGEANNE